MGNVIVSSPNEAKIISGWRGNRIIIGKCAFAVWLIETSRTLNLDLLTIKVRSADAETVKGVRVHVDSVAQVKVQAFQRTMIDGELKDSNKYDMDRIKLAATHFLGSKEKDIVETLRMTMEGHQRQILGTLTVEEIYKDRAAFSEKLREHMEDDLAAMGFQIVSYTMTNIGDNNGYMEALGQTQTAQVKREAEEGTARNEAEARKKVALYRSEAQAEEALRNKEAHIAINSNKEFEAASDRDLSIKRAAYQIEVNSAKAEAEAAGLIEQEKQKQAIVQARQQQEFCRAEVDFTVMKKEMETEQAKRDGESQAELLAKRNDAASIKVLAEAEADRIEAIGRAEANALRMKGEAEAAVLQMKAKSYELYGQAAITQMIVEKLPELSSNIAKPLSNVDKMVFVSSDGSSGSKLTGDVSRIMAQLPETVEALTGVNISSSLRKAFDKTTELEDVSRSI